MKVLSFALLFLLVSCAHSAKENTEETTLELDSKKLEGKSHYSFTVVSGELNGKTFNSPSYVQTSKGLNYDGDGKLERTTITFLDPNQGNSDVEIQWNGNVSENISSDRNADDGTYIEFKVKLNDKPYHFIAVSGTTKVISYKDIEEKNTFMERIEIKKDVKMTFEGAFKELLTGEEVNIHGTIQIIN